MWHLGTGFNSEHRDGAGLMLGLDDLRGSNFYYSKILCYKLFNITIKKALLNLKKIPVCLYVPEDLEENHQYFMYF